MNGKEVVGGLAAYELDKFEQDRREIYIYDLAVVRNHRRRGVATGLIGELSRIASKLNVYVIFVQANPEDAAAIALYESLGTKETTYHFDIKVPTAVLQHKGIGPGADSVGLSQLQRVPQPLPHRRCQSRAVRPEPSGRTGADHRDGRRIPVHRTVQSRL